MNKTKKALLREIKKSLKNNYGIENFDEYRFGKYPNKLQEKKTPFLSKKIIKKRIKRIFFNQGNKHEHALDRLTKKYLPQIEYILNNLSKKDQELYKKLIVFRLLGFTKVKLPRNNPDYWEAIEKSKGLGDPEDFINPHFLHFILKKMDLNPIGFDIQFYHTEKGIAVDFLIEQYAYKYEKKRIVSAEKGDCVFDLGGCWGDTALYFAHEVGDEGKVYSFEFIPGNIEIFNKNLSMNAKLQNRVILVPNPVTNKSNDIVNYKDKGPASRVSPDTFVGQTGTCKTVSIDEFVKSNDIKKVDFIKMDIESAEMMALEGAIETIKKFKPKLAIAIYHSFDEFVKIPNWILNLDVGYEIFIDHFSIHSEETICFAKPKV